MQVRKRIWRATLHPRQSHNFSSKIHHVRLQRKKTVNMRRNTLNMDAQTLSEGAEERRKLNGNLLVVQLILIQSRWWWWGEE